MEARFWGTEWSDALSMSNPEIDAEHKSFLDMVNQLNAELAGLQQGKENIIHSMENIMEHASAHFAHEERLLAENDYPAGQEHADIHERLTADIRQALKMIRDTDHISDWVEAGRSIEHLLLEHLQAEDTKYIDYLRTG